MKSNKGMNKVRQREDREKREGRKEGRQSEEEF